MHPIDVVRFAAGLGFLVFAAPLACSSNVIGTGTSSSGSSGSAGSSGSSSGSSGTSGNTLTGGTSGSTGTDKVTGAQAVGSCLKLVDAAHALSTRCEYGWTREQILQEAANGSCGNVAAIENNAALLNQCIPHLQSVDCVEFDTNGFPDSCKGQLILR
jgi:hypothetical protein